jgi:hypothetical protein
MSETIEQKLDRILLYLEDDPRTDTKGLVSTVKRHSRDIERLQEQQRFDAWKFTALGAAAGALVAGGKALAAFMVKVFF